MSSSKNFILLLNNLLACLVEISYNACSYLNATLFKDSLNSSKEFHFKSFLTGNLVKSYSIVP